MAKRQRTEAQARRSFVKLCAFVGLILAAFLFVFGGLFQGSAAGSVLELVWRIIFWIALVIYIAGCVLGLLSGVGVINLGE